MSASTNSPEAWRAAEKLLTDIIVEFQTEPGTEPRGIERLNAERLATAILVKFHAQRFDVLDPSTVGRLVLTERP